MEKKEIWKLLELLNEYEKETKSWYTWKDIDSYDNCVYWVDCDGETEIVMYSDLYSKCYGFIQRLVEQDKIELSKVIKLYRKSNEHSINTYPVMYEYSDLERVLMLLSISEQPIDLLISLLK